MTAKNKKHSSLSEIELLVRARAKKINAEEYANINFYDNPSKYGDMPAIQIKEDGYHLVGHERGVEVRRWITEDLDEFLFWIFYDITFNVAQQYELTHRVGEYDRRTVTFPKQIELLSTINQKWGERAQKIQIAYIETAPIDYNCPLRVNLELEYINQGMSPEDARRNSRIKYPLPYRKKLDKEDIQRMRNFYKIK
jgi:hypothetical protein